MTQDYTVFFAADAGLRRRWLRCYQEFDAGECAGCAHGYHNAMTLVGDFESRVPGAGEERWYAHPPAPSDYAGDPRWPVTYPCGLSVSATDHHQVFEEQLYTKSDGSELFTLRDAPVGACWDAWWHGRKGPDGRCLTVKLPFGHDWCIDSRCSNCGRPDDNVHRCWVRHGLPEDGTLHVDKNGDTCAAGAGSIDTKKWHGFLHHGKLHL